MIVAKLTHQEFGLLALRKQLEFANVPIEVLYSERNTWRNSYEISVTDFGKWNHWFIEEYRLNFNSTKKEAENEFLYFNRQHGMKLKNESGNIS